MTDYPIRTSETGAAAAELVRRDAKLLVKLYLPVGGGRRLRLELVLGQAPAAAEALGKVLEDIDAHFGLGRGER